MLLKKFVVGALQTNCYIFGDSETKEVALIDPGGDASAIKRYIEKNDLKLRYVINTHGHGDHIAANADFAAALLIHELDADCLEDPHLNLSSSFGAGIRCRQANRLLKDGDVITVGGETLEVLHTPGHTAGGICLRHDDILFSGDTLFYEGVGRTDLPNSSWEALEDSIKNRLFKLPDACRVLPGHGPETTIGHEKNYYAETA